MAKYEISQVAYGGKSSCLIPYPRQGSGLLYPTNILGSQDRTGPFGTTGRAPYQQIILNGKYYENPADETPLALNSDAAKLNAVPYFLRLTIPRNVNYDLDFALLLVPDIPAAADLDQLTYQFVRYIHVPKSTRDAAGQSYVVAYERPKFYDSQDNIVDPSNAVKYGYEDTEVQVVEVEEYTDKIEPGPSNENKLFFKKNGSTINYYEVIKDSLNHYSFVEAGDYYGPSTSQKFAPIGATMSIINHSWVVKDSNDYCTYDIIFKPRDKVFSRLYLYLIPNSWDNDIRWLYKDDVTNTTTQFYGRHVDLKQLKVELYEMVNLIGGLPVKRMGIWGRSELMFTINGEEIKIGPSGYYELQDFDINYIGVAALDNRDQFTIDVQYLSS